MKFNSVQVLRAWAVLSVVILHSQLIAPDLIRILFFSDFGWIGVRLFFVISGFIIAERISLETSLPQFLLRRYLRVFPLYALTTVIAFVISAVTSSAMFTFSRTDSGAPFAIDNGILYILGSLLIMPQDRWPFLMVGWSLEYEVVFYATFGCAFFLLRRKGALAIMLALSVLGAWNSDLFRPFFDSLFIYFLLGCLSREFLHLDLRHKFPVAVAICLMTALLSILHLYGFLDLTKVGFVIATAFCFGAMIVAAVDLEQRNIVFSGRSTLAVIGDISFSLYLVHWLLFPVVESLLKGLQLTTVTAEILRFTSVFIAIILSWLTWRFVERPLNRACRRAVAVSSETLGIGYRDKPSSMN